MANPWSSPPVTGRFFLLSIGFFGYPVFTHTQKNKPGFALRCCFVVSLGLTKTVFRDYLFVFSRFLKQIQASRFRWFFHLLI